MKKILKNTTKTKDYLASLSKIYAVFLWAKWAVVEVPWSGEYDKTGMPLVYTYYDCNGCCDEYRLVPINHVSSGVFYGWFFDKAAAENSTVFLNEEDTSVRKSIKREKELDRSYDYAESCGFANAAVNVGFVKRRANRKLRHDEKQKLNKLEETECLERPEH